MLLSIVFPFQDCLNIGEAIFDPLLRCNHFIAGFFHGRDHVYYIVDLVAEKTAKHCQERRVHFFKSF
jgi:hypothetical protein